MIGALRGRLLDRSVSGEILVEVSGVGYRVQAGPATAARLGDLDGEVFVWTHHHLREDVAALYGFATRTERDTFEALLGAHGVGPTLALAILSIHPPANLVQILTTEDAAALCLVPGVGKKTAARLLIELKSRLSDDLLTDSPVVADGQTSETGGPEGGSARSDVRDALAGLGYAPAEIAAATSDLTGEDPGEMLRVALQKLSRSR